MATLSPTLDSPAPASDPKLIGIKGWLLFPAVEIAWRAVKGFLALFFEFWLYPEMAALGFAVPMACLILMTAGLQAYTLYAAHQFFKRRRNAPTVMITFYILCIAFVVVGLGGQAALGIEIDARESTRELGKAIIPAMIWIPYFVRSKRVKATFTT